MVVKFYIKCYYINIIEGDIMDYIITFFRDTISGFWYFVYIIVCIFFIFVLLGIVGDRKRAVIEENLKKKKAMDIASGKEAKIAAMETKQILNVMTDSTNNLQNNTLADSKQENDNNSVLVVNEENDSNKNVNLTNVSANTDNKGLEENSLSKQNV